MLEGGRLVFSLAVAASAQTNFPVYTDAFANGFQNWSWGTDNIANMSPVHSGNNSISLNDAAWMPYLCGILPSTADLIRILPAPTS